VKEKAESPVIAELRELLDALCEETITPEQHRRLEELVLAHPEAEAYYVQFMSFYADLIRSVAGLPAGVPGTPTDSPTHPETHPAGAPAPTASAPGPARPAPAPATGSRSGRERPRRSSRRLLAWGLVGSIGVAAGVFLALWLRPNPPELALAPRVHNAPAEPTDETVAVLLRTFQAEWEDTGLPTRVGSPLPPGQLVLKTGYAQIEFYNGATVILEGPAEFRIVSRAEGYCARGKLRATVPAQAQGFRIGSPAMNLVDRGTEFGLEVGPSTAVHVFRGAVDLYAPNAAPGTSPRKLKDGEGVRSDPPGVLKPIDARSGEFLTAGELARRSAEESLRRQKEWQKSSAELQRDPSLLVYFTFQGDDPLSRTLKDLSRQRHDPRDGAVVGAVPCTGRWNERQGLEFKRVSDRVRFHVSGELRSMTLATWVRPDALPNLNNSLMMADGWDPGGPHWQIGSDGTLILGVQRPPEFQMPPNLRGAHYHAPGVITPERFGRWIHLAVVYDGETGRVTHYVDGQTASTDSIWFDGPLKIGNAELGNWNVAGYRNKSPVRNFNGCMDEFLLFSRPLTSEEVARLYAVGRPGS
jgi:hypothetical protein